MCICAWENWVLYLCIFLFIQDIYTGCRGLYTQLHVTRTLASGNVQLEIRRVVPLRGWSNWPPHPPASWSRTGPTRGSMGMFFALAAGCGALVAAFTALGHRDQPRLVGAGQHDLPLNTLHVCVCVCVCVCGCVCVWVCVCACVCVRVICTKMQNTTTFCKI